MDLRTALLVVLAGAAAAGGCQSAPVRTGTVVIGTVIADHDVQTKGERLQGRGVQVSDAWLGPRVETFVDLTNPQREFILYPVRNDPAGTAHYVAESTRGTVTAFSKQRLDEQRFEDVLQRSGWRARLLGKTPEACAAAVGFGEPFISVRSRDNGEVVMIYEVAGIADLGAARYCMLRFDFDRLCRAVALLPGVSGEYADPDAG